MDAIPLEDSFSDVINKAQRGHKLSDEELAARADVAVPDLAALKGGTFHEAAARKVAPVLKLGANALVELGKKSWHPAAQECRGLLAFNTVYEDMTVNSFLVFDPATQEAAAFDTGADCGPMLAAARAQGLRITQILLTHTHIDHVVDLPRLRKETGAPALVGELEGFADATPFSAGKTFQIGGLRVETRQTSGHAKGGITFVVTGLARPVAVVGDALFACSMGGGMISYEEALRTNRAGIFTLADETIVCPGHGPLTTVGEQKRHNPFYPEFQG